MWPINNIIIIIVLCVIMTYNNNYYCLWPIIIIMGSVHAPIDSNVSSNNYFCYKNNNG